MALQYVSHYAAEMDMRSYVAQPALTALYEVRKDQAENALWVMGVQF